MKEVLVKIIQRGCVNFGRANGHMGAGKVSEVASIFLLALLQSEKPIR